MTEKLLKGKTVPYTEKEVTDNMTTSDTAILDISNLIRKRKRKANQERSLTTFLEVHGFKKAKDNLVFFERLFGDSADLHRKKQAFEDSFLKYQVGDAKWVVKYGAKSANTPQNITYEGDAFTCNSAHDVSVTLASIAEEYPHAVVGVEFVEKKLEYIGRTDSVRESYFSED